jgi:hypothetical protein
MWTYQVPGVLYLILFSGSGTHPFSYLMGTRGSFRGGKATGAWSWPLTSIQYRGQNEWRYTSTPQYAFMAWCSVKKIKTGTTSALPYCNLHSECNQIQLPLLYPTLLSGPAPGHHLYSTLRWNSNPRPRRWFWFSLGLSHGLPAGFEPTTSALHFGSSPMWTYLVPRFLYLILYITQDTFSWRGV